jgi:hypothetical protein
MRHTNHTQSSAGRKPWTILVLLAVAQFMVILAGRSAARAHCRQANV